MDIPPCFFSPQITSILTGCFQWIRGNLWWNVFLNAANKTHYLFCISVTPAAFCGAFFPFIIISKIITALLSSLSKATLCVLSVFCVNEAAKKLNAKTGEEKVLFY